jgi:hypothetical protein
VACVPPIAFAAATRVRFGVAARVCRGDFASTTATAGAAAGGAAAG